ncbi:MAG: DNA translocase FtsK [Planctomycetes bacterium]|nr:DNA translocase FtsK [Planctomycetota bacterium]
MPRSEQRLVALRFCVATLAWVACLIGWVSLLTFDVADPPGSSVWPPTDPPANLCGPVGAWLAHQALFYLGIGSYALLLLLTVFVVVWSYGVRLSDPWLRFVGLLLIGTVFSASGTLFIPLSDAYPMSGPGGVLGASAVTFFQSTLGATGTLILLACAFVIGLLLAADELVLRIVRGLHWAGRRTGPALARGGSAVAGAGSAVAAGVATATGRLAPAAGCTSDGPDGRNVEFEEPPKALSLPAGDAIAPDAPTDSPAQNEFVFDDEDTKDSGGGAGRRETRPTPGAGAALPAGGPVVKEFKGTPQRRAKQPGAAHDAANDDFELPGMDLLKEPTRIDTHAIELRCREKALILEQTLNEFRLEVRVVAIETGPVITVFELKLAPGIKVSQIASLTNDMARALKAPAVRVVAPLPGKNTIGIEVPNIDKEKVRIKDVLDRDDQRRTDLGVPLYLGKDAAGQPLVADVTRMPHLLIAGTTGSGKSVCVASVIMSILMSRTPREVQLILVDPKVVELAMFKDIPHLMCPIVTEVSKAESILDWAATKMDERYALFAEAGVKDIRAYNSLGEKGLRERFEPSDEEDFARVPKHLPYIVIIIDELADLMMTSAKEVEFYLCRLAQKSRAVGIHLIVSTQRPQANVVTGLVKANLPCRIAFRVSSRLDSRIVLDQNGGEVLMGQGDMLFLPPGSSKLVRAQGTFIDDEELRRVVRHCRDQQKQDFNPELVRLRSSEAGSVTARDELFDQAVEFILESGRGSVSLLQRRLTVGYGRASRLIDQMYEGGIVGEYKGSQAREVLLSKDEWNAIRARRDAEEALESNVEP